MVCYLGQRLKGARETLGKSQEDVSQDTGLSREMISYWESGTRNPSMIQLSKLADYYGLNISMFLHPDAPDMRVAFRSKNLSEGDREVVYWARRLLSDYWALTTLPPEG